MKYSLFNIDTNGFPNKLIPGITKFISLFVLMNVLLFTDVQAQTIITGMVRDSEYHTGIPGAIISEGYSDGQTTTDASGSFQLSVPTNTTLNLTIVHKGFQTMSMPVIASKRIVDICEIDLQSNDLNILEIYQLSDRASRRFPVTHSHLRRADLAPLQGVMQVPYYLQNVAGIYTSSLGNQFGESRLNIRGFGQEHISVMFNGVALNYPDSRNFNWSTRAGFQQMPANIQIQRGTNSNRHYSPFGGGSLNLLTMPTSQLPGGSVGFEYGAGEYMRSTVKIHSGLLNEKIAISVSGARETSNGIINGTWADTWSYYLSMTYAASEKQRFEVYAMGAPQRHGTVENMQHIAAYSHRYAKELGIPEAVLDAIPQSRDGRYYNQGLNAVDPEYSGQQYWNGNIRNRHAPAYLNEHEHYSHAPLGQFNWYANWTGKISQHTMFYYSGLAGENSGVSGDVNLDYTGPSPFIDYNSTIAENQQKIASEGILSNSVRNLSSAGAMSRVNFQFNDRFRSTLGINASSANIIQYQEVRDLLGGSYYLFSGNQFDNQVDDEKQLGDLIGYHHSSNIRRIDFSGNIEYSGKKLHAFLNGVYSMADQNYTNHFRNDPDNPGQKYMLAPAVSPGYQIKSGLSYQVIDPLLLYANYSYISREPDNSLVIDLLERSASGSLNNLIFKGFDTGFRLFFSPSTRLEINYYDYLMVNNTMAQKFTDLLSNEFILHTLHIDQRHQGIEFEAGYQPVRFFEIGANASLGNWVYSDDATGILIDIASPGEEIQTIFTNKDLAAGNAPQLQLGGMLAVHPVLNSYVQANFRFFRSHFAAWNPVGALHYPGEQLWELPEYYLVDLHAGYTIVTNSRFRIALHGHVFNLLDELYIQDAMDNGALIDLPGDPQEYINSAAAATVFTGLPRTYSFGIQISF